VLVVTITITVTEVHKVFTLPSRAITCPTDRARAVGRKVWKVFSSFILVCAV